MLGERDGEAEGQNGAHLLLNADEGRSMPAYAHKMRYALKRNGAPSCPGIRLWRYSLAQCCCLPHEIVWTTCRQR